jgi:hypothetical protein
MARQYGAEAIRTAHDTTSLLRALEDGCPEVILLNLASFDSRALMQSARTQSTEPNDCCRSI